MIRRIALFAVCALTALIPSVALAQDADPDDGVIVRVNGDYTVGDSAAVDTVVVINGDATVTGVVEKLVVINGDAHVAGEVEEVVTVVRGTLDLSNTAVVDDVVLIRSELERMPGATVTGDIERQGRWFWPGIALVLGAIFIVGSLLIAIVTALLFAAFGGQQLSEAAAGMTQRVGPSIGFGLGVAILGPVAAGLLIATVVGLPLGLALLLVGLPLLGLLGAVVAATWIGFMILNRPSDDERANRPFGPALLGIALMAALMIIPGIGFVAVMFLSIWGMGALVDRIVLPRRERRRTERPRPAGPLHPEPGPDLVEGPPARSLRTEPLADDPEPPAERDTAGPRDDEEPGERDSR